jgi:cell division protein FtsI/penicillin-binding protein 2
VENQVSNNQSKRLWIVAIGIVLFTIILVARLVKFQVLDREMLSEYSDGEYIWDYIPARGTIYDRNGAVFAANSAEYQIGASPNFVIEPEEVAEFLAPLIEQEVYQLKAKLQSNRPYILLASRVPYQTAKLIREQEFDGVQIEPLPRRLYPQGKLMSQTIGIMDFNGDGQTGIEGYYNRELAGESVSQIRSYSPLVFVPEVKARSGVDLVLTIDRQVQYTVEDHLQRALENYEAESGSIIVMDPRTGAILALASEPTFDPYFYYKGDPEVIHNPVVSKQFEPGSVIKLITMAAALDSGVVTPDSTYYDNGELFVGGHKTVNWTREAHGTVDMTTLLAQSLNVGAATLALWMGTDTYYDYMQEFGFGRPTGIDLLYEAGGLMPLPGDPLWEESFLATNAYGQSLAVTPIQMITAISALANDGKMMQPYLVQEIRGENSSYVTQPKVISQPVSKFAAQQVTAMAVNALNTAIPQAQVPNYTVAGKTGTAQIAENGIYLPDAVIGTFVGYLPADDPEIVVYVKLDRPGIPWGSQTAAPTFATLARDLVVLLDIPPDNIRLDENIQQARAAN